MAERSPVDDGFHMPAEWAPHERCWMGWPCRGSLWSEGLEAARTAYAALAQAIAGFEPVTMLANPAALDAAPRRCGPAVTCQAMPLDDPLLRDTSLEEHTSEPPSPMRFSDSVFCSDKY